MKKLFLFTAAVIIVTSLHSQFVYDYVKAADDYFMKADYNSAAEYYEKYLNVNKAVNEDEFKPYTPQNSSKKKATSATTKDQALYRLAESYRLLNYPSKAAPYYKRIIDGGMGEFPLAKYHYGTQLRALEKYPEAEQQFKGFLDGYSNNDEYRKNAERELKNLQFIQAQLKKKDLKYYTVNKAPGELNKTGASYAPVWLNKNTLLFTSTRPVDSSAKNMYSNRVFEAVYTEGSVKEINTASLPQDKDIQQGVVSITPDGNTMFLTRWGITGNKKESSIFSSRRTGDGWSNPEKLNSSINTSDANTQQPFVTTDGKYLLFSSNRKDGQGGYDLWYAPLSNGNPGTPVNMGNLINTPYDEQAPSYHEASKSLVFSTNGRIGMGGYDFFQSTGSMGNWTEPVNLGYPVNSVKDDIYFTTRGSAKNMLEDVLLSSDRDAACCLELFSLKKIMMPKQISGTVVSCETRKPIAGATVYFVNPVDNTTMMIKTTGADGSYAIVLDEFQPLKAVANFPGYVEGSISFNTPGDAEAIKLDNPSICLDQVFPPPIGTVEVIDNIYFEYDKADLNVESYASLDKLANKLLKNPDAVLEIGGHTDSKGKDNYNQVLSEARAQSCVDYLISKGVRPEQLSAKGYGEQIPIAPNQNDDGSDNPEGRAKNRRTEFKVLESK